MFTGIIEETGKVIDFDGVNLKIEADVVLKNTKIGDSIAINGCCQTVTAINKNVFCVNVSQETLKVTDFNSFQSGTVVNLERALPADGRFGGHIVQGHVETLAVLYDVKKMNDFYNMTFSYEKEFDKYIVKKGSVTLGGVSLTVADLRDYKLTVAVIPHTFNNTNLKTLNIGDKVNMETDILGRYIEKILPVSGSKSSIDEEFLAANGFM